MAYKPLPEPEVSSYKPGVEPVAENVSPQVPAEFLADSPACSCDKTSSNIEPKEEVSLDERWKFLRAERDRRLAATDYVNTGTRMLGFEQRAQLYAYRNALRDLPSQPGAPWTTDTIPWPACPAS